MRRFSYSMFVYFLSGVRCAIVLYLNITGWELKPKWWSRAGEIDLFSLYGTILSGMGELMM